MTPRMKDALDAIRRLTVDGLSPTLAEIAVEIGLQPCSKASVSRLVHALAATGKVTVNPHATRGIRILEGPSRAEMETWSDDEVRRVAADLKDIARRRRIAMILASPSCPALERGRQA